MQFSAKLLATLGEVGAGIGEKIGPRAATVEEVEHIFE
jgi:hypothetical protein